MIQQHDSADAGFLQCGVDLQHDIAIFILCFQQRPDYTVDHLIRRHESQADAVFLQVLIVEGGNDRTELVRRDVQCCLQKSD